MEVDIGGVKHIMKGNGTAYKQGVTFIYSEQENTPGEFYYRFVFDDGSGPWYVEDGLVTATPVLLTNTSVTPTTGTSTTLFTFSTTYSEWQNSAPTSAQLFIDSTAYPMTHISGSYNTGALFQYNKLLPVGNHTFYVVFSDGKSSWADPFAPATYEGPNVGTTAHSATPVQPGTILAPSHDQDPDYPLQPDLGDLFIGLDKDQLMILTTGASFTKRTQQYSSERDQHRHGSDERASARH